jgi:uncharacterized protein
VISRRSAVIGALIAVPVLAYVGLAVYALSRSRLAWQIWWLAPLCWILAWCLARWWHPRKLSESFEPEPALHWTPRDRDAVAVVRTYQQKVEQFSNAELIDPEIYRRELLSLAKDLSRHYHPGANDPLDSLTVPEVLAAVRLAVDDIEQWLLTSVPGSRLLTIRRWRQLPQAPKWISRFQNAFWAASVLLNPANALNYLTSRLTLDPVTSGMETEILASVYLRCFERAGFYLIEMYSGRLRGGADAYRRAFSPERRGGRLMVERLEARSVTVALVGQVSSGKSSLINALTGSNQAAVDILPETRSVQRYQMSVGDPPVVVTLLDTPGYGESGAQADQLKQIQSALRQADAVLLVIDAHSPAREADRVTLAGLDRWYADQQRLKPPPLLAVLTHVDLLRPVLEWTPPYDWREPARPKEQSIHDAVAYARELLGTAAAAVVPVCSDAGPDRRWGILEELVPALVLVLQESQSAALLRAFEHELDRGRVKTLLKQVQNFGSDLWRCWVEERLHDEEVQTHRQTDPGKR